MIGAGPETGPTVEFHDVHKAYRVGCERRREHDRKVTNIRQIVDWFRWQAVEPVLVGVVRAYSGDGRRKLSVRMRHLARGVISADRL